ncbi:MAG: hypothetical protein J1F31_02935 [Erysipelotrichales bacterium]|nr:hypothetical protein [Erysipelotrichales bacterium]
MKKRIGMLVLLSTLLLTSCRDDSEYVQKDWHINTIELANEYFPKYFEFVENSLLENDIQFEKEYYEHDNKESNKRCTVVYNITDSIFFSATFSYNYNVNNYSYIELYFYNKSATKEEALNNIPQNYINVMIDVNDFCANNFLGTGEAYNSYYNEVVEKHNNKDFSYVSEDSTCFVAYVSNRISNSESLPYRDIQISAENDIYEIRFRLIDYLTDINIWNK